MTTYNAFSYHSSCDIYKMHFQNYPHGQTLPLQGCMQHIGVMEYTMYIPHPLLPQAVTWHLCSAWRLRGARCWIVLILFVVKPKDASTKTIALLLLLQRRSDFSLSVLTLFLPCRSTFPWTWTSMNLCSMITRGFCCARLDRFTLITIVISWISLFVSQFNGRLGVRKKNKETNTP